MWRIWTLPLARSVRACKRVREEALHRVTLPSIGAIQRGNQAGGVQLIEARDLSWSRAFRIDAVNATFVIASAQVGPAFEFLREIFRMFEHEPVHVRDVERAIGPSLEHGWPKPIIRRGDEFAVLLIGGTMA